VALTLKTTQVLTASTTAEFTALQAWVTAQGITATKPLPYSSRVDSVTQRRITLVLDTPDWTTPPG
jgi:hypothetical protein